MKITFIRPHFLDERGSGSWKPLVFALLAGLTPRDVILDYFDERSEPIPYDHDTDLVALTVETYTARRAYQIATHFRQRGIPVVMGGHHPSFLPEEALVFADAVVIGDAEGVWEQLVRDAQQGKLQRTYKQPGLLSLQGLRFDRSVLEFSGPTLIPFFKFASVQYGRGCRHCCDFCSVHSFYGSQARTRPVAEVVAEIEMLDRKFVAFVDDNLFVGPQSAEELFRALIPLNIRWGTQIGIDIARNARLMDLMAESGCSAVIIGFESLRKDSLGEMKKGWNLGHLGYDAAVQEFRDRGIMIFGTFVFGYDHDTTDSFEMAVDFALRSRLTLANFLTLTPTPGTALYDRLKDENRLFVDRWWLDPDYRYGQATFRPLQMQPDQLPEGCENARQQFYRYGNILKRTLDPAANSRDLYHLAFSWGMNWIVKHDLHSNIGCRLGAVSPLEPALERVPVGHIEAVG